jgi:hypothetical protein
MLTHAQENQQAYNPNDERQYCADLSEHVRIERRHKGSQAVPEEEQCRAPSSKSSHFTISLNKMVFDCPRGQFSD